jgi:hypothetical protein
MTIRDIAEPRTVVQRLLGIAIALFYPRWRAGSGWACPRPKTSKRRRRRLRLETHSPA